jgi:hypothetical protein
MSAEASSRRKDANPQTRVVGVLLLSELRGSAEACVEVAEACVGEDPAAADAAARTIHHFSRPRGTYQWTTGELPPALTQIARTLEVAEGMARTDGPRAVIARLQDVVADELARHARRNEELRTGHDRPAQISRRRQLRRRLPADLEHSRPQVWSAKSSP